MSVMIQVRNVPVEVHRELKIRANGAGTSLSEFILAELRQIAQRPTRDQMLARLLALTPVELSEDPADVIRQMRDADDPRDV